MLSVIVIDDFAINLKINVDMLKKIDSFHIIGSYTNPYEGYDATIRLKPDILFLDIEMDGMSGIDIAKKLSENNISTQVIFVTAHDSHAVQAFEVEAFDYIMKPLSQERIYSVLQRINRRKIVTQDQKNKKIVIKFFGGFSVGFQQETSIKFRSNKTKEMFAYLIANRNKTLNKEVIIDAIWPDNELSNVSHNFYNAIYYIRKALEDAGITREYIVLDNEYHICLNNASVDLDAFMEAHQRLTHSNNSEAHEHLHSLITHYVGAYLEDIESEWCIFDRETLRLIFINALRTIARWCLNQHDYSLAEQHLLRAFLEDPYDEDVTLMMLQAYLQMKHKQKGLQHFITYKTLLEEELNIEPRKDILQYYHLLKAL